MVSRIGIEKSHYGIDKKNYYNLHESWHKVSVRKVIYLLCAEFSDIIVSTKGEREMNKTPAERSWEADRKTRKNWGELRPTTRIIPNKKKNPKIKHKGMEENA